MAHYLIAQKRDDMWHVLTEVEAESLARAIDGLDLADGESVKVYRIAANPRTVKVHEEVVRKVSVE